MGLINVKSSDQLLAEEKTATDAAIESANKVDMSSLANYIRGHWDSAYKSKNEIQEKMLKSLQRYEGRYEASHLAAIKQLNSSEIFIPLTNIKCRAAEAWIKEVLLQPGEKPWKLEPSPIPTLSPEKQEQLLGTVGPALTNIITQHVNNQITTGQVANPGVMTAEMQSYMKEAKKFYEDQIEDEVKELSEDVEKQINDVFVEGGFYQALEACIHDLNIFPSVILKGPIYRNERRAKFIPGTGLTFEDVVVQQYERRNPLDIYPAPESSGINDSYLLDKITITPKQLTELKGVPGFNDTEIDAVLIEIGSGGLREWTTFDTVRLQTENKSPVTMSDSDKVDALEYWGTVKGEYLTEWGMVEQLDPTKYYDICAWLIGTHIIKAMLNPDPMGVKPYSKASFIEIPDSFWGISVSDVIEPLQTGCNAIARAIINNSAIASGPLVERNIDRIPSYESKTIYPWKMFDSTDITMSSTAPAYRFYQPPNTSDKLLVVFQAFMKQADELSGIPAYAHGDVTVGGAGRTASGLEMLTNNANRGIKAVIRNIDKGLIEPTVTRQYYFYLSTNPETEVPDLNIVAKGSIALMEKELMSVRRNEFLQLALNPVLTQILGIDGLKYVTEEVAKAHGIDIDKLFPSQIPMTGQPMGVQPPMEGGEQAPVAKSSTTTQGNVAAEGGAINNFQSENGR